MTSIVEELSLYFLSSIDFDLIIFLEETENSHPT